MHLNIIIAYRKVQCWQKLPTVLTIDTLSPTIIVFSRRKMPEITLPAYLQRVAWETTQFTNEQLEIMLAASCLRYLGGLTDILFVLGLSEKIRERQKDNNSLPLHYATEMLHDLAQELTNKTVASTDKETLRKNIDNAQKVITKRSVLELF